MEPQSLGGGFDCLPDPHFPLGADAVLLSDFVLESLPAPGRGKPPRLCDLGCGAGAVFLLCAARRPDLLCAGVELREEAAGLARENIARNGIAHRARVLTGDLRRIRELLPPAGFTVVAANPPYLAPGSGRAPRDPRAALARMELSCAPADVCGAAAWLLPPGGEFCLVHRPERLCDLLCALRTAGLEPKLLRTVQPRPDAAPCLILVRARRGGAPGLRLPPPLILSRREGG